MDRPQIIATLKQIIARDLDLNLSHEQIEDDASFLEDGLALDSISMAELIDRVERRFSIRILDEDLEAATFQSVGSVASLVQKRLADRRPEVEAP